MLGGPQWWHLDINVSKQSVAMEHVELIDLLAI